MIDKDRLLVLISFSLIIIMVAFHIKKNGDVKRKKEIKSTREKLNFSNRDQTNFYIKNHKKENDTCTLKKEDTLKKLDKDKEWLYGVSTYKGYVERKDEAKKIKETTAEFLGVSPNELPDFQQASGGSSSGEPGHYVARSSYNYKNEKAEQSACNKR